jgi:ABC-2 type transport system ATP-binding protein
VGDKKFREKCYGRMDELLSGGRTLFMVSHSENDLKRFCTRGLYIRQGELIVDGGIDESLAAYNSYQDR